MASGAMDKKTLLKLRREMPTADSVLDKLTPWLFDAFIDREARREITPERRTEVRELF